MSSQAVAWAIVHAAGGMAAKAVLLSIANYANEYGECWASQATLAEGAECSVRQLRRVLGALGERGLVERTRRGGAGKGRETDVIRLRMRELPGILSAKPRKQPATEQPAILSGGQGDKVSEGQPAILAAKQPDILTGCGEMIPPTGQVDLGATGQNGGGNRTIMSANPKIPPSSSSLSARERGSAGGLRGEAGEVVALVNHPKLDPAKDPDLVMLAEHFVAGWRREYGLSLGEIAEVISLTLAKRDQRDPGADRIATWKFFEKPMSRFAASKAAAAAPLKLEERSHEQPHSAIAPRNAAERESALTGARRASWARVLAERKGA